MPKSGTTMSECEDMLALDDVAGRYAVADGATEAFDSGRWARRLVDSWVSSEIAPDAPQSFREWVEPMGRELQSSWEATPLSWYAEEKARSGSFAAFVGLSLIAGAGSLSWKAVSLGDSCLFHLKNDHKCDSWPIADSTGFGSAPVLVPSSPLLVARTAELINVKAGNLEAGEMLLMATDAVSCWLLNCAEEQDARQFVVSALFDSERTGTLESFFSDERGRGRLKDDDIAILAIRMKPSLS
jgi:hypothetical protein